MKKGNIFILCCLALVGLTGCGNDKGKTKDRAVEVRTQTVKETAVSDAKCYSGTVEENTATAISFATAGTVSHVYVNDGQTVSAGKVLADIDATTLKNAHNATLSMLHQAEDAYARMKKLHDTNSISEIQWVDVQSKLEQARSSELIARRALEDARVTAPCSGVIAEKTLEPGQNVLPSMSVMKIVDIQKVKVNISVPENEVSEIRKGDIVSVTVAALGGQTFTGRVTEKDVTANTLSRTYSVKATIDNPDRKLMPGMICDASISVGNSTSASMHLPLDAVQLSDKNFYFVWTVQNGKAVKKYVEVGNVTATGVTVKSGLSEGDKVIIEGQQKVSENMEVREK